MPSAIMRVAIIGCGYVGTSLAEEAQARGMSVYGLTRNAERIAALKERGVATVEARVHEVGWEAQMPSSIDAVVYCASSTSRDVEGYRFSYIEGQKRALAWAEESGAKQYIYTSSTSVIGEAEGGWVTETSGPWSDTPFAEVLLEAEQLVLDARVNSTVLRLAGIYGPGRHLLWDRVAGLEGDTLPGYGDIVLNLIHRDDIVGGLLKVIESSKKASKLYNLADNAPATRQEIVDWCAEQLRRVPIRFSPEDAMQDKRGRRYANGRRPSRRISNKAIKEDLGWEPMYPDFRYGYRALGLLG